MELLFWVCTILLGLSVLGAFVAPQPWIPRAGWVLVVIDLVILGVKVMGLPR